MFFFLLGNNFTPHKAAGKGCTSQPLTPSPSQAQEVATPEPRQLHLPPPGLLSSRLPPPWPSLQDLVSSAVPPPLIPASLSGHTLTVQTFRSHGSWPARCLAPHDSCRRCCQCPHGTAWGTPWDVPSSLRTRPPSPVHTLSELWNAENLPHNRVSEAQSSTPSHFVIKRPSALETPAGAKGQDQ